MLKPYKKMSKRELKQDKFVKLTIESKEFVEKHSRQLMWGGVAILVIILLVSYMIRSKRESNVQANELLGKASFFFDQGDVQRGEAMMKQLIDTYEGVTAAGQGCFLLARYYWQRNDFENAGQYFQKYLSTYSGDPLLTAAANAGYADVMVEQGKHAEAGRLYEKAARVDKNSPQTPSFLYSAALAYLEANEPEKALKLANELITSYDKSDFKSRAEVLLNQIKLKV